MQESFSLSKCRMIASVRALASFHCSPTTYHHDWWEQQLQSLVVVVVVVVEVAVAAAPKVILRCYSHQNRYVPTTSNEKKMKIITESVCMISEITYKCGGCLHQLAVQIAWNFRTRRWRSRNVDVAGNRWHERWLTRWQRRVGKLLSGG